LGWGDIRTVGKLEVFLKICPKCQLKNRDTARFCSHCSTALPEEIICAFCNTVNPPNARYCNYCAAPLRDSFGWQTSKGTLVPGTILVARYFIIRKLGEGGMGSVYLVTDSRLGGKKCALKEMSDSAITNPVELFQAREAFQREAEMLSGLSHPVLPRVTDFFSLVDKHYLVMDFADGRPLDDILVKRTRPFPVSQVLHWADQLCDVLLYLHDQQPPVIYRDLKPGNIMLAPDRMKLKLVDFGIARTFKPKQSKDTIAIGTPGYSPPEQYGKGQTDQRSDIYALGATLHHLLTLRDPGDDPFRFPPVSSLNSRVPERVSRVIMKAVEQDRENRWQSVQEMVSALDQDRASVKVPQASPQPVVPQNLPSQPLPMPALSGNIPSTPLSSLAASFLSQNRANPHQSQPIAANRFEKILDRLIRSLKAFTLPTFPRKNLWRDYVWVAVSCVVAVVLNLFLGDFIESFSWGYWGEILGGVLFPLPFLFSAVFIKRVGAAGLPVLLTGFFDSDLHLNPFLTALAVELPFLVAGYKRYRYPLLFLAALIFGMAKAYMVSGFFAFEGIMKTWMVAFLSPLIVYAFARLVHRI
jgi:serine/threonine-protein kinase